MTDTKARILDAALALFNEQGTANVTTNHIAEALGMSPGNLYYHYRNKAEIVRALFSRIQAEWATNYAVPPATMPNPEMAEAMMAGNFEIQARYRFFFRDLTLLLNADPTRIDVAYHGVDRIVPGSSRLIPGGGRINLTLRRAHPA